MRLRKVFVLFLQLILITYSVFAQNSFSILSWNLKDFGKSKSDAEIELIANTVKDYDIVLIQEVVAKDIGGAQAVGRLGDALSRLGSKWEYRISDATSGESSYKRERYAYLWKPSKVSLVGKTWLEKKYGDSINREPFLATFKANNKEFTLINFHAITKSMQPETQVKFFKYFPSEYAGQTLIFCGDFNLPQDHSVFNPLKKMGYKPALVDQKTSLKKECVNNECLASELDNIFYPSAKLTVIKSGVIHFYKSFPEFKEAEAMTDHLPVFFEFSLN